MHRGCASHSNVRIHEFLALLFDPIQSTERGGVKIGRSERTIPFAGRQFTVSRSHVATRNQTARENRVNAQIKACLSTIDRHPQLADRLGSSRSSPRRQRKGRTAARVESAPESRPRSAQKPSICWAFISGSGWSGLSLESLWRREWDSNPRYLAVNTLSKRAPSATRPSLRFTVRQPFDFITSTDQSAELGREAWG